VGSASGYRGLDGERLSVTLTANLMRLPNAQQAGDPSPRLMIGRKVAASSATANGRRWLRDQLRSGLNTGKGARHGASFIHTIVSVRT
jgi:hypothetical protein